MDKGQLYLQLRVSVSMTVMNNKGVFQELWNNFHFLTKKQIQEHHLVPFSEGEPSLLSMVIEELL